MAFQNPGSRPPRITVPTAPADVQEFTPTVNDVPNISMMQPSNDQAVKEPATLTTAPNDPVNEAGDAVAEAAPTPGRKPGRPRKGENTAKAPSVPARTTARKKKQEDVTDDQKTRTSLYLLPKDHKRLKMLCVEIDMPLTEFAASACLDAMYYSYQCNSPACNCEFIVRSSMIDDAPACPMCGNKKLTRPYLP